MNDSKIVLNFSDFGGLEARQLTPQALQAAAAEALRLLQRANNGANSCNPQ